MAIRKALGNLLRRKKKEIHIQTAEASHWILGMWKASQLRSQSPSVQALSSHELVLVRIFNRFWGRNRHLSFYKAKINM